jgi:hypothetical protein
LPTEIEIMTWEGEKTMKMKLALAAIVGCAALCLALPASGQTYNMVLTGANDGTSYDPVSGGNAYGGFYQATINGVATNIICDDAQDNVSVGLTWKATELNATQIAANLGSTMFGSTIGVIGYAEVATLVEDMFNPATSQADRDALSSAIWAITYNQGASGLSGTALAYYNGVITEFGGNVAAATTALASDGNLTLLTPYPDHTPGSADSQEYWTVPEGGAALLYLLLAGMACFGAMRFRSVFGNRTA